MRSMVFISLLSLSITTIALYYVSFPELVEDTDELDWESVKFKDGEPTQSLLHISLATTTGNDITTENDDVRNLLQETSTPSNSNGKDDDEELAGTESSRYLFPIQTWEGGPNWNYKNYRIAIEYAINTNRILVTIPFHIHHTQPDGWLTHGWREFNETFDSGILQEIVPLTSPEDYMRKCGGKVDVVLHNPFATKREISQFIFDYNRTRNTYKELWDVELPGLDSIVQTVDEVNDLFVMGEKVKCLGIYRAMDFVEMMKSDDQTDVAMRLDRHLQRAPFIRNLADHAMPEVCNGQPFVAMQWRNKTGEMCAFNMWVPWGELDCSSHFQELRQAGEYVTMAVYDFMKQNNFECLFLTFPPGSQEIIEILRLKIPKIVTSFDLCESQIPGIKEIAQDNYFVSLLEQEIATRAAVFMGCNRSSWTQVVTYSRTANGQQTLYLRDIQNMPNKFRKLV